jgi:membrane-associated protease RseP (regulator of RpoE activity)
MAVLLVAHELSHAFLARIHKIRLDSAGVVFFGILPFGAFVEPDEKELQGLEDWKANQVLAAGSAMNMIVAVIAFTILLALAIVNEYYLLKGAVVAFVARCLALIVALNVLVGVVNLLPLPMFDGHRLMKSLVKSKSVARIITIVAAAAFVITFLPWLFR